LLSTYSSFAVLPTKGRGKYVLSEKKNARKGIERWVILIWRIEITIVIFGIRLARGWKKAWACERGVSMSEKSTCEKGIVFRKIFSWTGCMRNESNSHMSRRIPGGGSWHQPVPTNVHL
jgi:hypothetical protein